jgi:uncharacterized protein (TIGR02266 family)
MTQETRKDRRVKIVSLNVRYKSATVDEFIENHAHDVSRGGIYIKTATPFPSGTLLKFEIRLASDQTVITGVGRVVWQRDTAQGTSERPSGMGVKFIKVDDTSKAIIDRLVTTRADAGKAYESEPDATVPQQTSRESGSRQQAAPRKATAPAALGEGRKTTAIGLGTAGLGGPPAFGTVRPAPAPTPETPAPPASAAISRPPIATAIMFPTVSSDALGPPKQEPTVMKQAAELLEEALREVGGSVDEIGTNPLFAGTPSKAALSAPPRARPSAGPNADHAAEALPNEAPATATDSKATKGAAGATARGMVAALAPAPGLSKGGGPVAGSRAMAAAQAPTARKKSSGLLLVVLVVAAAAVAAVLVFRDKLFEPGAASSPTKPLAPTESVTTTGAPPPSAAAQSPPPAAPPASASASAAPQVGVSSSAPSAPARVGATVNANPGAASASATKTPVAPATLPPIEKIMPARPSPAAPAAASLAPETPGAAPAPPPAPRRPKPAKPSDDNPY